MSLIRSRSPRVFPAIAIAPLAMIHDDHYGRYVIIFSTRTVADEWWRTLQDKVSEGKHTFSTIQRVTPQFYLHDPGTRANNYAGNSISTTLTHHDGTPEFMGKIIFSPQGGRRWTGAMDVIPIQDITDHISGNFFFIRSKHNPSLFWHYSPSDGGSIKASSTERTKFRISIRPRGIGSAKHPSTGLNYDGKIMTGSDNVEIALAYENLKYVSTTPGEPEHIPAEFETQLPLRHVPEMAIDHYGPSSKYMGGMDGVSPASSPSEALTLGQGTLRVGNRPETFRFRDLLDGLSGEWELA
ncbi:hypothetical protein DFH27DRAFT_610500 [Peziza echinospora]|nr:hypothetical protein DFH27DRAFT_610500 [Peziza echinospora]